MSTIDKMTFQMPDVFMPVCSFQISNRIPFEFRSTTSFYHFGGIPENQTLSYLFALTDETCTICLTRMLPISSPQNLLQPKKTTLNEKHFLQKISIFLKHIITSQNMGKWLKWNKLKVAQDIQWNKPSCLHNAKTPVGMVDFIQTFMMSIREPFNNYLADFFR